MAKEKTIFKAAIPPPEHKIKIPKYSLSEELISAISHGVGAALGIAALILCVIRGAQHHNPWAVVSGAIYGGTLTILYLMSTLYHALKVNKAKRVFRVIDHCSIFLLIAGTYTPFTLIGLRGPWGWGLFSAIWTLAIAGVIFKLFYTGRFKRLSTLIYIAMGWLVLVAIKPMWHSLDGWTLGWLFAGGAFYTLGTIFYHRESIPYSHAIWHMFVIAGSVCHFVSVSAQIL